MGIASMVHVSKWLKFPIGFIYSIHRLKVSLSVGYAPPSDIDLASDFNRLTVPDVRDLLVSEHTLFLSPGLHIEENNVVVVEEMQAHLSQLDLYHAANCAWDLLFIIEFV